MKRLFIISILCLLVAGCYTADFDREIDECARELNIQDTEKFHKGIELDDYLKNQTDDVTCMMACSLRKKVQSNGITLYKGFLKFVDEGYKQGFGNASEIKREDVETKINNCFLNKREECEFFKCVEPFKSPISDIFMYQLVQAIANSFFEALFSPKSS